MNNLAQNIIMFNEKYFYFPQKQTFFKKRTIGNKQAVLLLKFCKETKLIEVFLMRKLVLNSFELREKLTAELIRRRKE